MKEENIMDDKTNIQELKNKVMEFVSERDWEKFHHPKELAISLVLESSELLEIFQWKEKQSIEIIKKDSNTMQRLKDELADVIIYAIDIANYVDIDISEVILEKIKKNSEKYPINKAKGSNKKYTEL